MPNVVFNRRGPGGPRKRAVVSPRPVENGVGRWSLPGAQNLSEPRDLTLFLSSPRYRRVRTTRLLRT